MNCPIDNSELVPKQRDNITVHTCPKCQGIWLDRAELNKIIAQSEIEYPDLQDFKDRGVSSREHQFQSPGSFFGRFFEH